MWRMLRIFHPALPLLPFNGKAITEEDGDGIEPGEISAKYELLTQLRTNAQPEEQQQKVADLASACGPGVLATPGDGRLGSGSRRCR